MQHFDPHSHLKTQKGTPQQEVNASVDDGQTKLIEACMRGDRRAQKAMYDSLSGKMYALCIRYMGDRETAADVLQEGFVTLFTKLGTYTGDGSFEGWARKIFVNTALMSLRKNDVMKQTDDIDTAVGVSSHDTSAIQDVSYKELLRLISELPAGFRAVFNLYAIEGYNHKEIAEALGITETTSRTQLLRARTMLQKKIKGK